MANAPGLTIGPMEPDKAGDLVGNLGVHNRADRLLQHHAKMYPVALVQALSRPHDQERTAALDLDEVEAALTDQKGRQAFFKDGSSLVDASVRGTRAADRVISVVYESPSGRTMRGVLAYDQVPGAERRFEEMQQEKAETRAGAVRQSANEQPGSVEARDADLEARLQAVEREFRQAVQAREAAVEELEKLSDPEPFEGYDETNADGIIARVKDDGRDEFGRAGLERMLAYEESHKNRTGVKNAIDGELAKPAPGEK